MRLHYQKHLTPYARKLRKAGNLAEVFLWRELKNKKLFGYRFLRQRPIGAFIVDFYCHALDLAVEIDGAASHNSKTEKDKARQRALESLGVRIIRFADADVRCNLTGVVLAIKSEILRLADLSAGRQARHRPFPLS